MKKQWIIGIIISILLLTGVGAIVSANEFWYRNQAISIQGINTNNLVKTDLTFPFSNGTSRVKFRGIWGYEGSNETSGYLAGVLVKRECVVVLKGMWNTTDNTTKGNIVGLLKRGYFNGRIIIQNQTIYRIVGLYCYDTENNLLNLCWMTRQQTGWMHSQILIK